MSVLATMQAQLGYYADMLQWTIQDGIIKAVPKRQLSDRAHKVVSREFKRRGGDYVSNGGSHYFELVLAPRQLSPSSKIALAFHELDGRIFEERSTS